MAVKRPLRGRFRGKRCKNASGHDDNASPVGLPLVNRAHNCCPRDSGRSDCDNRIAEIAQVQLQHYYCAKVTRLDLFAHDTTVEKDAGEAL